MLLTPPQWGSAPTRTSNVNIVRHVKATVEIQKKKAKIQLGYSRIPPVRADWYPHTGRQVRSPLSVAAAPALLSVSLPSASVKTATASLKDAATSSVSMPDLVFFHFCWLEWAKSGSRLFLVFSSSNGGPVCCRLVSAAATRRGDATAFTRTWRVNNLGLYKEAKLLFQNKTFYSSWSENIALTTSTNGFV